ISNIMDKLGFEEGEMIEHSIISKSIERAQKNVEENNFGIRKRLLEYDDVMNSQRTVIYSKRLHALMGERIGVDITNMIYDVAELMVENAKQAHDYELLQEDLLKVFAMEVPFDENTFNTTKSNELGHLVSEAAITTFKRKMEKLASIAYPVIKDVYETKGQQYENILVPVTDGKRVFNVTAHLEKAFKNEAREVVTAFEKQTLLYVIDDEWKEHLRQLDELRNSVQNASYEQKDPLLIYKLESFGLFKEMIDSMNRKVLSILMRGQIPMREPEQVREARPVQRMDLSRMRTQKDEVSSRAAQQQDPTKQDTREVQKTQPIVVEKKVGRNDLCPCGSGKKFKNCHGA
ncbi:MAG: SEC-C metal-binding domain-containing protein, partial [Paludibacter sp.]